MHDRAYFGIGSALDRVKIRKLGGKGGVLHFSVLAGCKRGMKGELHLRPYFIDWQYRQWSFLSQLL